jgi:hypothetical protein
LHLKLIECKSNLSDVSFTASTRRIIGQPRGASEAFLIIESLLAPLVETERDHIRQKRGQPMGLKPRMLALAVTALCGTTSIACSGPDSTTVLSPTRICQVTAPFTDDDGGVATNISGLACMPTAAARSTCLVIDDQGRFAQLATIGNGQVAAGSRLPLIGRKPSRDTVGQPPAETGCSG